MERLSQTYLRLERRRLKSLQVLREVLKEGCQAVSRMDTARLLHCLAEAEQCSSEVRFLDLERQRVLAELRSRTRAGSRGLKLPEPEASDLRSCTRDLRQALHEVRHQSRVLSLLLQRTRRFINVMMDLLPKDAGALVLQAAQTGAGRPLRVHLE